MTEVNLGSDAQPKKAAKAKKAKQPRRRSAPISTAPPQGSQAAADEIDEFERLQSEEWESQRAAAAESVDSTTADSVVPPDFSGQAVFQPPANPYLVTGWKKREHTEFDVTLPSGQVCRIRRLERDDLLRMDLMQYLDTFTPMLLEDSISDLEREKMMTETVKENPEALQKMLKAIDKVVMAASVKPAITENPKLVNYGNQRDWGNPNFTPVALLDDIDTFERMYIFGAAFGRDMDDLKSVLQQAQGVASVAS